MRLLHTMLRVGDLQRSIDFYTRILGMKVLRQSENTEYKYTLAFVGYGDETSNSVLELTYNWDSEDYGEARYFGHLAYEVDDIYAFCEKMQKLGITVNRPPRDGNMAFVRSPDNISIEILQKGSPKESAEPWKSMANTGVW